MPKGVGCGQVWSGEVFTRTMRVGEGCVVRMGVEV